MYLSKMKSEYIDDVLIPEIKESWGNDKKTLKCLVEYKTAHIRNLQLVIEAAKRLLREAKK